jgi:hypothetical protein
VNLQPYGLVFTREFIIASKGQPAIYLNGYGGNKFLHEGAHELFNVATKSGRVEDPLWRLLPFLNAMHEKYDFTWDREWRVLGGLTFKSSDLVCLILPDKGEEDMKEAAAKGGIAVVSPEWSYESIVAELAAQQRSTER